MASGNPTHREPESSHCAVAADRFVRIARARRLEPARASQQDADAELIRPDREAHERAQHNAINKGDELKEFSQATFLRFARTPFPHPGSALSLSVREPPTRRPPIPPGVAFLGGRLLATTALHGYALPLRRRVDSPPHPSVVARHLLGRRRLQRNDRPSAVLLDTPFESLSRGGVAHPARSVACGGSSSHSESVTPFTPPTRQDGPSGFGSHADAEPVRLFAPTPIRLKRSLHISDSLASDSLAFLTRTNAFARERDSVSSAPERNSALYSAAKPLSTLCSPQKKPAGSFFLVPQSDRMLVYVPCPVDKHGNIFPTGMGSLAWRFFHIC